MFHPKPKAIVLRVLAGNSVLPVAGWESCYTLGIARTHDGRYASIALMSGVTLIDGFNSAEEVHAFNRLLIDHPKFFAGTPTVAEMYSHSGGEKQFFGILEECMKKMHKRKAA